MTVNSHVIGFPVCLDREAQLVTCSFSPGTLKTKIRNGTSLTSCVKIWRPENSCEHWNSAKHGIEVNSPAFDFRIASPKRVSILTPIAGFPILAGHASRQCLRGNRPCRSGAVSGKYCNKRHRYFAYGWPRKTCHARLSAQFRRPK